MEICSHCHEIIPEGKNYCCIDSSGSCEGFYITETVECISHFTYVDFYLDFFTKDRFPNHKFRGQRFGQAFLSAIYPEVKDDELFYEEKTDTAIDIIMGRYVDFSLSFNSGRKYTGRKVFQEGEQNEQQKQS
jgi:hypothetical protein